MRYQIRLLVAIIVKMIPAASYCKQYGRLSNQEVYCVSRSPPEAVLLFFSSRREHHWIHRLARRRTMPTMTVIRLCLTMATSRYTTHTYFSTSFTYTPPCSLYTTTITTTIDWASSSSSYLVPFSFSSSPLSLSRHRLAFQDCGHGICTWLTSFSTSSSLPTQIG